MLPHRPKILLISAQACRLCGKARSPRDLIFLSVNTGNSDRWGMCHDCYAWHNEALMLLARQKPPTGCANCRKSLAEIQAIAVRRILEQSPWIKFSPAALEQESRKMWMHGLDGVYVLLCRDCSELVEQLNHRRLRGTPYGASRRIF